MRNEWLKGFGMVCLKRGERLAIFKYLDLLPMASEDRTRSNRLERQWSRCTLDIFLDILYFNFNWNFNYQSDEVSSDPGLTIQSLQINTSFIKIATKLIGRCGHIIIELCAGTGQCIAAQSSLQKAGYQCDSYIRIPTKKIMLKPYLLTNLESILLYWTPGVTGSYGLY